MLQEIFDLQAELNDVIFEKLREGGQGRIAAPLSVPSRHDFGGEDDRTRAEWWRNYLLALQQEAAEAQDSLPWKWWSRDCELTEEMIQNAKVELIDILHFWVSACFVVGLTPERVLAVYRQKHAINLQRQEGDYRMSSKTEEDNRGIQG